MKRFYWGGINMSFLGCFVRLLYVRFFWVAMLHGIFVCLFSLSNALVQLSTKLKAATIASYSRQIYNLSKRFLMDLIDDSPLKPNRFTIVFDMKMQIFNAIGWSKIRYCLKLLCLLTSLNLIHNISYAQFYLPSEQTLRVGDTLSISLLLKELNVLNAKSGLTRTVKLSDYQDKFLVLDFWASWCGPCRESLKKMTVLKEELSFDFLAVNYEGLEKVRKVLDDLGLDMETVYADTSLAKIFPHSAIPHMVWINKGKVIAVPKHEFVSSTNLYAAIHGKEFDIPQKLDDRILDPTKVLFGENNGISPILFSQQELTIYAANQLYKFEPLRRIETKDSIFYYANNVDISRLLHSLYREDLFISFQKYPSQFMEYEEKKYHDSFKGLGKIGLKIAFVNDGLSQKGERTKIQQVFRRYLNQTLNIDVKLVKSKKESYLVLKRTKNLEKVEQLLGAKGNERSVDTVGQNRRYSSLPFQSYFITALESLIYKIEGLELTTELLVDHTGLSKAAIIDFEVPLQVKNLATLNKSISRYGLQVVQENGWSNKIYVSSTMGGPHD